MEVSLFSLGGHRRFYPATGYNSHEQGSLGIESRLALFWLRAFGYTAPLALYLLHKYSVVNVQVRYALTYRRWGKGKYRVLKFFLNFSFELKKGYGQYHFALPIIQ